MPKKIWKILKTLNLSYSDVVVLEETIKIAESHPTLVFLEIKNTKTRDDIVADLEKKLTRKKIKIDYGSKIR